MVVGEGKSERTGHNFVVFVNVAPPCGFGKLGAVEVCVVCERGAKSSSRHVCSFVCEDLDRLALEEPMLLYVQ